LDARPEKLLEILNKEGIHHPIDGTPVRIIVRYDSLKYTERKQIVRFLQGKGFQQLGNTTTWILRQKD